MNRTTAAQATSGVIGVYGGTFDPIHFGHLRIALDVAEALAVERIHFVPLGGAVHRDQPGSSAQQRFSMVSAATQDEPRLFADDRELRREGPSYTVDTLQVFRAQFGPERPLCLMMGSDAFNGFLRWREPLRILQLAHLVIMQRPGYRVPDQPDLQRLLTDHQCRQVDALQQTPAGKILFHNVTQLEISSSDLRARLNKGLSVRYLTPLSVIQIIDKYKLYTQKPDSMAT